MLFLNVPYSEKEDVKKLGARWNPQKKKWYVEDRANYIKFAKWIIGDMEDVINIVCDHFYVVETNRVCYKCGNITRVIGFAVENYFDITPDNNYSYSGFGFYKSCAIQSSLEFLSQNFYDMLKEKYNYYLGYSKTTKKKYIANHCDHCNSIQGEFPLFCEPSSPFFVDSVEKAKNLKFYKFQLPYDIIIYNGMSYSDLFESEMIKKYSTFIEEGEYDVMNDTLLFWDDDEDDGVPFVDW